MIPLNQSGSAKPNDLDRVGIVVIGRNEGLRLVKCLESLPESVAVVYVDSGSTDDSIEQALRLRATVVYLDLTTAFTAARARNMGWRKLLELSPHITFVQFIDGDCELFDGWLTRAQEFLQAQPQVAVVGGRRREREPNASIYNALCDMEWDTPIGQALACGGDAMMRAECLVAVDGYRDDLIAGEEPELCLRLRTAGWQVWRLDHEMTLHDAAIHRFGQWWSRTTRGGFAFAQGAWLHGAPPHRHWVAETRRAIIWGGVLPAIIVLCCAFYGFKALALFVIYPLQVARVALRSSVNTAGSVTRLKRSAFFILGRFPECIGAFKFYVSRLRNRSTTIIEYK